MMKVPGFLFSALCAGLLSCGALSAAEPPSIESCIAALTSSEGSAQLLAIDHLAAQGTQAAEAVAPLTKLLTDTSAPVRAHAAHALGQIGGASKPAVPALVEILADSDDTVRQQAVKAIIAIKPSPQVTVPLCVKLLEDSDPAIRHRVLQSLGNAGPDAVSGLIEALKTEKGAYWACVVLRGMGPAGKEAIPVLATKLQDSRPEIRREAALALGAMGEAAAEAAPQIAALLGDQHAAVAATYALGRIGTIPAAAESVIRANVKSEDTMLSTTTLWAVANTRLQDEKIRAAVTERLIARLNDDDPYVRVAAARALAALPPAPQITLPIWEAALQNADATTFAHALDALVQLGGPAVPQLVRALSHESLRPQILDVLRHMGPEAAAATPALAELVEDHDPRIAGSAVMALAAIGPAAKEAVPALVRALQAQESPNAHAVVYALGEIGPDAGDAGAVLLKLVGGSNQDLALISAWSLNKIDPSAETAAQTVPVLTAGLSAAVPTTRRGAAESLGQMGTLAKPAIPALQQAQKDDNPAVRAAATRALELIGG